MPRPDAALRAGRRRAFLHLGALALVAALSALGLARAGDGARGEGVESRDEWFVISIGGTDCGWLHEVVRADGERVVTRSQMHFTVGRAGASAQMELEWEFDESPLGTPRTCTVRQRSGEARSGMSYRFDGAQVSIEESAGGRDVRRSEPLPARPWWTPAEVETRIRAARRAGEARIAYRTIDPTAGLRVIDMVSSRESLAADGSSVWTTTTSALPIPSREELDPSGHVVRSVTPLPVGEMVARRSTERAARAAARTGASIDLIARSIVEVSAAGRRLPSAARATLRVRRADGQPLALESSGAQVAAAEEGGAVRVTIDAAQSSAAGASQGTDPRFRTATVLVDCDDPGVRELAASLLRDAGVAQDAPPVRRAEALRDGVFRFITTKSYATAFAGASEVVRSRAGDCSEHAVLLAALLRAQGIPSRVASGLVYADRLGAQDHVFAWHMWTQALLEDRWRDLDATLPARAFHPGHLLLATSAQDDAQLDADFNAILGVLGNLRIEVVDVD